MASKHHLSHAAELFYGDATNPAMQATNGRPGVPFHPLTKISLGAPVTLDINGLMVDATSTELPNVSTKTYTTATDNTTPLDGAIAAPSTVFLNGENRLVWVLDVPRNVTGVCDHGSAVVATTVTINGYDVYGVPMAETGTFTAGTTQKTFAGKKAFKYIYSFVITSAGNATTNTINLGWGDVLGLPYKLTSKSDFMNAWVDDVIETLGTVTVADTATATATTGDVRGTYLPTAATDGGKVYKVWASFDPSTFGVTQYSV
jgi:hypothetical protein